MSYIGESDLVFNNNNSNGIFGGGFNVQSIMMKSGISPIMTLNNTQTGGTTGKVSDIFEGLAVPAYAYYNNYQSGGSRIHKTYEDDSDDDIIEEDLHDKLLELMRTQNNDTKQNKKKLTRKSTRNKKSSTKKKRTTLL
jgi:hypothetical protein